MTAQPQVTDVKAYVFCIRYGQDGEYYMNDHCIAGSQAEALEMVRKGRQADHLPGDKTFFGIASAVMRPAIIDWYEDIPGSRSQRRRQEQGYYAFLDGVFYCKCGEYEFSEQCRKEVSSSGLIIAHIYRHSHWIKPL